MLDLNEHSRDDYKPSYGSGTDTGYRVEARYACADKLGPKVVLGKYNLDENWCQIHFEESPIGVPNHSPFHIGLQLANLYSYQAAQALRWWFHAALAIGDSISVETRIVEYKVKYEFSYEAVSAHELIGYEGRTALLPDWGIKRPDKSSSVS